MPPRPSYPNRRSTTVVAAAVLLAFLIGLAYVKWLEPLMSASPRVAAIEHDYPGIAGRGLIYDEIQYLSIARCLSSGAGYAMSPGEPSAVRVPGYPLYVAALFRIFGPSVKVALLGNAFLVALLPALTFALAKSAFGRNAAIVAAFFCALDPGLYFFGLSVAYS